jgi:hypothetical protein
MYARQPPEGHFSRTVRVPRNYSGNAFRNEEALEDPNVPADTAPVPETSDTPIPPISDPPVLREEETPSAETMGKGILSPGFRLDLGRFLHRGKGGFGFEELLIVGLIFLLSQSETKDDLVFLLLLLLFIQ